VWLWELGFALFLFLQAFPSSSLLRPQKPTFILPSYHIRLRGGAKIGGCESAFWVLYRVLGKPFWRVKKGAPQGFLQGKSLFSLKPFCRKYYLVYPSLGGPTWGAKPGGVFFWGQSCGGGVPLKKPPLKRVAPQKRGVLQGGP